jgi:hypothetical protein
MKFRSGKIPCVRLEPVRDERYMRQWCGYCRRPCLCWYVGDECPPNICVGCYTALVWAGVDPVLPVYRDRWQVSQARESV